VRVAAVGLRKKRRRRMIMGIRKHLKLLTLAPKLWEIRSNTGVISSFRWQDSKMAVFLLIASFAVIKITTADASNAIYAENKNVHAQKQSNHSSHPSLLRSKIKQQ
jgi:hypothetical protein